MACAGCAGRRKVITEVAQGKKALSTGVKEIRSSVAQDVRKVASGIRNAKLGLRMK